MDFAAASAAVRQGADPVELARQLVAAMTPEERLGCLDGDAPAWAGVSDMATGGYHQRTADAAAVDRLGFPGIRFADGPRGCVVGNATAFPVTMARGATWDPELEERVGDAIGRELRAVGADLTGAVCVNVLRHPGWGRAQETYGEDPFHVGELGAALTRGLQRHVMACVKHFACNSMENARFQVDVTVDEVALHEVYLPHFRRIVDEGVASVMTAYNAVNGAWCGESEPLLADVLRGEWGFEGFTISDFVFGIRDAARSVRAGLDIEMPFRMVRAQHLPAALEAGDASWEQVDAAVERVVATRLRFDPVIAASSPGPEVLGAPEHRALAREVAARSVVLLRNEAVGGAPVLPIDASASVALIGPLADRVNLGDGGSSDVWDLACTTVADGLRGRVAELTVDDGGDLGRVAELAAAADVAIVVAGCTHLDEGEFIGSFDPALSGLFPPGDDPDEVARFAARVATAPTVAPPAHHADRASGFSQGGDRRSLALGDADVARIRAAAAANARTVVVLQAGSAIVVEGWVDEVGALVQAWYGGCEAGPGLADVLLGDVAPTARLPFSVPRSGADLPPFDPDATQATYDRWHGWRHLARLGASAAFPFGFGLSYTTFELAGSTVGIDGDALEVRSTVANAGPTDGVDVVQVYAELADPERPPRLVGFARASVAAGATAEAVVRVPLDRLATRDGAVRRWVAPSGPHVLRVARFAGDPAAEVHHLDL